MTRRLMTTAASALAVSIVAGGAFAQTTPQVVVTTHKAVEKTVGRTPTGIPIVEVSLSYTVSGADLDLSSHRGVLDFERRVSNAAMDACKELGHRYPDATPSDSECAKAATDKAMVEVRKLESAGKK